jgi:death on curing protein
VAIVYLSKEDLVVIHGFLIEGIGGLDGVRDDSALSSAVALPRQQAFGKELYPDLFLKAAVYARSVIMNHPFLDGNKRTGITSAATFLDVNGYILHCKRGEIEKFAVSIVVDSLSIEEIALWLRKHAKKA